MTAISSFSGNYRFLSNFFPCTVPYEGLNFTSSEHAFVAAKTIDPATRIHIASIGSPGEVKAFGRRLQLRPDWEAIKIQEMEKILRSKFANNRHLLIRLLQTGDAELIEGNWWGDKFWGVCNGEGENHLGKLLMKIRSEI